MLKVFTLFLALIFVPVADNCNCKCDCAGVYTVDLGGCCDEKKTTPEPTLPPRPTNGSDDGNVNCTECPSGYERIENYGCYLAEEAPQDEGWNNTEAEALCHAAYGGTLLTLVNNTDYEAIHSHFIPADLNTTFPIYWLGARYNSTLSKFVWSDGRIVNPADWQWWEGNDPNSGVIDNNYCLYALGNETHRDCLAYAYCQITFGYICQHDINMCL